MANLTELAPAYVDDVDAATMKALKINSATHSPRGYSVGDANPTGIMPWHLHKHTGSGHGHALYRAQPGIGTDKLISVVEVVYEFVNPFDGPTASSGTVQCTVNPTTSGDTIRVGAAANTYRFRTSGDGLAQAFDVLIGADASETARNLTQAIMNFAGTSGTNYHAATPQHPSAVASVTGDTCTITSRLVGNLGNSTQLIFDGTVGNGTFVVSGATLANGGGQHITQGSAYYHVGGWQGSASHGYRDENQPLRMLCWNYSAPTLPTVQNGGGATANVQLELMQGAATSLFTLTASGASDALGKSQYSANGGGVDLTSGEFIWARVPSAAGASWKAPPGATWNLYFGRVIG
jgi:hypothetical protein